MRLQRVTNYLLTHLIIATTIAFLFSFLPIFSLFATLFAGLVTLRLGALRGAILTVIVTIPAVLYKYYDANVHHFPIASLIAFELGLIIVCASNVLMWEFAVATIRQVSMNKLLQVAALFGVFCVSVVHLVYPDVVTWWGTELQTLSLQSFSLIAPQGTNAASSLSASQLQEIALAKHYATGAFIGVILMNAFVQLIIAKMWSQAVFGPVNSERELHHIRLSYAAGMVLIVSLMLAYFGNNSVVLDIMPIIYLLFCAAGLSVVHYLFSLMASATRYFWLLCFYLGLIFLTPNGSLHLLVMIALFDIWFDLRKRLTKV